MNRVMEKTLEDIYYDPRHPSSFGVVDKLYSAAKRSEPGLSRAIVKDWLKEQDAYTLHRKAAQKYGRRQTTMAHKGQQLQADLMDIRNHARENDGVNYLLTAVDCFSRRGWAIPVKYKTGERVAEVLDKVLRGSTYFSLQTDKGKEFYNGTSNLC